MITPYHAPIGNRGFFERHVLTLRALVAHQSDTIVPFPCWARRASRRDETGAQSSTPTPITMRTASSCVVPLSTGGIAPPGATGNAILYAFAGKHEPPIAAEV